MANNNEAFEFLDSLNVYKQKRICKSLFTQAGYKMHLRILKQEDPVQRSSGFSFEAHARARMQQWHEERGKELVCSMIFDVDVEGINFQGDYGTRMPESAAQFDCLLVTPQGRFIAIDFKSAGKKNYRAQQSSVSIAGGVYAVLYYLYPWIQEDLPVPAGQADPRPEIVRKRMTGIVQMDRTLRSTDRPPSAWRGIRFYEEDKEFYADLESVLGLKR